MSLERAKAYLAEYGRDGDVLEFDVSSATVELAAAAVGCAPERIAKTLSFSVGDRVALVVCAGDARIANPKFKERFGCKAKMLSADEAEESIGHAVGGVCPFGVKDGCDVYFDESLRRFDLIYPACGSSSSAIALTPDELAQIVPAGIWVDVCKLPAEEQS
ncbi:YbaK/EbsC family protein [Enterorhabdus mucosicola]|uniref:YbaK/EbsC family protein n=1 Tax=Adlercreutzia mucosicola TaxID=580026 RepID=A0A6N8JLV5_9ACTN|nr:YbaK/EbsC family protein [Adlercreutzia mucosicola]MVX60871.1 YbaK/EbsC family protein [Adlercreutzia mucosicola]